MSQLLHHLEGAPGHCGSNNAAMMSIAGLVYSAIPATAVKFDPTLSMLQTLLTEEDAIGHRKVEAFAFLSQKCSAS